MTKFYKHEAESIKESSEKQFVSQEEKDRWNAGGGEENNSVNTDFGYIGGDLGNNVNFPNPTKYIEKHFSEDSMRYYAIYDYRNKDGDKTIKLIIADRKFHYGPFNNGTYYKRFTDYSSLGVAGDGSAANLIIYYVENGTWKKEFSTPTQKVVSVDDFKELGKEKEQTNRFYSCNFELQWNTLNDGTYVTIDAIPEPLPTLQIKRGEYEEVSTYTGEIGELVMDITNKDLVLQDNSTAGGIILAKKRDLETLNEKVEEVFQSVSNGKNLLETTIADKGVTVSKENEVPTFEELSTGISEISGEDLVGKEKMLDVIVSKLPDLEGKLTLESSLSQYAYYMMKIGPLNMRFKENVSTNEYNAISSNSTYENMSNILLSLNSILPDEFKNEISYNITFKEAKVKNSHAVAATKKFFDDIMEGE